MVQPGIQKNKLALGSVVFISIFSDVQGVLLPMKVGRSLPREGASVSLVDIF